MQIFEEREREKTNTVVLDANIESDPQSAAAPFPPNKEKINKETVYEEISS